MSSRPSREIESFDNPRPEQSYMVESITPEFTCVCPKTGQPDFATLRIRYVPGPSCFELKSLKLYLWSFRDEGHFHEDVTNRILADLVAALDPKWMEVRGEFNVRGGLATTVTARHGQLPLELKGVAPAVWPGPTLSNREL
ncbi:MAG: NADPH-dependent 7-cyano-7-deazaguanine reductase QueF [Planctomycetota bacterium]|nr:MAG: NADPH-dependent 7-cyano-7-deazaguanine reductase QueF [Planctomycetota bacterium]